MWCLAPLNLECTSLQMVVSAPGLVPSRFTFFWSCKQGPVAFEVPAFDVLEPGMSVVLRVARVDNGLGSL